MQYVIPEPYETISLFNETSLVEWFENQQLYENKQNLKRLEYIMNIIDERIIHITYVDETTKKQHYSFYINDDKEREIITRLIEYIKN
jgi:hypothetical protein